MANYTLLVGAKMMPKCKRDIELTVSSTCLDGEQIRFWSLQVSDANPSYQAPDIATFDNPRASPTAAQNEVPSGEVLKGSFTAFAGKYPPARKLWPTRVLSPTA